MSKSISDTEFETLIFENQSLIHKICGIYASTEVDQQDLFQEIIINLWQGIEGFEGKSKISTWIYRVGLNTAISKARKSKRNVLQYTQNLPEREWQADTDHEREITVLYQAIDQLKPSEKAIILLYLESKSYEEISEIVGISKSNVSVKLVRLKKKLEQLMKPKLV